MANDSLETIVAEMREAAQLALASEYVTAEEREDAEQLLKWADRLESLKQPAPGWHPIESAPKDGMTHMLFRDEFGGRFIGCRPIDCPDDAAADIHGIACYPIGIRSPPFRTTRTKRTWA